MAKETDFFNATSTGGNVASSSKGAEISGHSSHRGSTSAKYRVASRSKTSSSTEAYDGASCSPLPEAKVPSLLHRISKNSMPLAGSEIPTIRPAGKRVSRFAIAIDQATTKGIGVSAGPPKLPQKLRQHVTRLRSQFALMSASSRNLNVGYRDPSPTASPHKTRPSVSSSSTQSKRFSLAITAMQRSLQSHQQSQQLEVAKEDTEDPVTECKSPVYPPNGGPRASTVVFQDLIRPLQSNLSCASLNSEWSSDEDDEAEQLFRQRERENCRMLRVCCSVDNLLLSVSDQAQEQKYNEAIARGASQDLVKLYQFAIKQVVSVVFGRSDISQGDYNNSANINNNEGRPISAKLDGKEAQYAMEFLLEITERIGRLDAFVRSVFVGEINNLLQKAKKLEEDLAAAAMKNVQLQIEIRDLRDFHEQEKGSTVEAFSGGRSKPRFSIVDDPSDEASIPDLAFNEIQTTTIDADESETNALELQCQELSRHLEMAKQEIRMSHHERDTLKARVAEISSALFHDSELGMLRNQLQSEKKRVRILERENLTMRETNQDQALKLQSLQTATAAPVVGTTGVGISLSTANRQDIGSSNCATETSSGATSTALSLSKEVYVSCSNSIEEQVMVQTNPRAVILQDNPYNFTGAGEPHIEVADDSGQAATPNWFLRIVNPQPTNTRNSRKKKAEPTLIQPVVSLSKFLAGLMMGDKQVAMAQEESKVRRQGNAPSLNPPVRVLSARREMRSAEGPSTGRGGGKKRRPQSAAAASTGTRSSISLSNTIDTDDCCEEIIGCCLQLVWAFYQRFLLAVEAQTLLGTRGLGGDPTLGSSGMSGTNSPATEPVSLPLIVFHFFLERCSREVDAMCELEQFVRCIHSVRNANYSLELFCQFLEETRSRQELYFFLWVCQSMDNLTLGIPYHDVLPNSDKNSHFANQNFHPTGPTRYLCVLKATYLARTIFRVLHFKVLCRPLGGKNRRQGKPKRSPRKWRKSNTAVSTTTLSLQSSPKRKPKTRLSEAAAATAPFGVDPAQPDGVSSQGEPERKPLHVAAQEAFNEIMETNHEQPITLEGFNKLLLQFAVVPSAEELTALLGTFYLPTGDERKIPVDVFLALLMETYSFQLHWQRDQLKALFIHLNRQGEFQQRVSRNVASEEGIIGKGDRPRPDEAGQEHPKLKIRKRASGKSALNNGGGPGGGNNKYMRGLSRNMLRELLLEAGIAHDSDLAQMDVDWFFATLVASAGGSTADITFEALFSALAKMGWLDSSALQVDSLVDANETIIQQRSYKSTKTTTHMKPAFRALHDTWRMYARRSLAVCNNDPNAFIRRHSERMLHYIDQHFLNSTEDPCGANDVCGAPLQSIREFLAFAWRVTAKRTTKSCTAYLAQTCLTEVFFACQALRPTVDMMSGYHRELTFTHSTVQVAAGQSVQAQRASQPLDAQSSPDAVMYDGLRRFYDTSRMNSERIVRKNDRDSGAAQLRDLENVLVLYSAYFAHLFQRFSEARFNCCAQVSFHRWRTMVYELQLVHPRHLPFPKLHALFASVVELSGENVLRQTPLDQDIGVGKTQFTELFVLIAIERHCSSAKDKLEKARFAAKDGSKDLTLDLEALEGAWHPARIMTAFCCNILAPRAFMSDGSSNALVERNFTAKLSCPLVGRALLEYRAFLRAVFFYYAKQDEVAADELAAVEEQALLEELRANGEEANGAGQIEELLVGTTSTASVSLLQPDLSTDFQLEKTKRSSMSFGEFQTFLAAFRLLDKQKVSDDDNRSTSWSGNKVTLSDAQHIFSSVMALDNDDTEQLEFDEFAAAIMALAVYLNPSPFTLWHQKFNEFATGLQKMWDEQELGNH